MFYHARLSITMIVLSFEEILHVITVLPDKTERFHLRRLINTKRCRGLRVINRS